MMVETDDEDGKGDDEHGHDGEAHGQGMTVLKMVMGTPCWWK